MKHTTEKEFLNHLYYAPVDYMKTMVKARIEELEQPCQECHGKGLVEIQENRPDQDDLVYVRVCICQV
jgi:hypothetical protein